MKCSLAEYCFSSILLLVDFLKLIKKRITRIVHACMALFIFILLPGLKCLEEHDNQKKH